MFKLSSLAAAAIVVSTSANAQTASDAATYVALMRTAVAGLPPIATSTILGDHQDGAAFSVRYGNVSAGDITRSLNNFTATAVLPGGGASSISLTAGASAPSQGSSALVLGIGGDTRLTDLPMSDASNAMLLRVGLNGEFGYSHPTGANLLAGSVGLPFSLIARGGGRDALRFVPFFTPAFGFGDLNPDAGDSRSGMKFMLGGGAGIFNRSSSVAVNLAFQHVFVDGGQTQFGLGLVLGGR
jgi:hypothetical protein